MMPPWSPILSGRTLPRIDPMARRRPQFVASSIKSPESTPLRPKREGPPSTPSYPGNDYTAHVKNTTVTPDSENVLILKDLREPSVKVGKVKRATIRLHESLKSPAAIPDKDPIESTHTSVTSFVISKKWSKNPINGKHQT